MDTKPVQLRKASDHDKVTLFELITTHTEWLAFNGPYIPYEPPTMQSFENRLFKRLKQGDEALLVEFNSEVVGTVSFYWVDERTRWLEVGIVIYDSNYWGQQVGRRALIAWVTHIFNNYEVERVGLTTWSGNPRMIASAQAIGMQVEARLRKVRYYNGVYYDSVKLGVLREEWAEIAPTLI